MAVEPFSTGSGAIQEPYSSIAAKRGRGVRATPAGATLVHHAQLVVQQLERMRRELSEYPDGFSGRVRLFANTTATAEFLPAALAAFLSQQPQIDIDLKERSSREIVRAVAGNVAEIGIVGDEVNPSKELETFPFAGAGQQARGLRFLRSTANRAYDYKNVVRTPDF